ncbi:SDR family NAD(P)-dependent oxidoreductase [Nocardioides montaniterrae]
MRPWTDVPPQHGRRFVITGANSGVGLAVAQILGSRGAEIVLACRSVDKGEAAARTVPGHDKGRVDVRRIDLADLDSVRAFADDLDGDVDVLVNNAGVLGVPHRVTPEGVDEHFAANYLGHFLLTNLLLQRITDRVVVTGSREHRRGVLELDDLAWERRPYKVFGAYAASKLACLLFLTELDRRLRASGSPVRAVGAHPGATASNITSGTGNAVVSWIGHHGQRLVSMPAWRGALNSVYAATMDVPGNTYIGPSGLTELYGWPDVARRSRNAEDAELARSLWERSEQLVSRR